MKEVKRINEKDYVLRFEIRYSKFFRNRVYK